MINVEVRKSSIQGKGVYASKNFKKGEVLLEIDDSHTVTDYDSLTKQQHEFDCDYLSNGKIILMQEPEKYINHSCDPSTYVKTINGVRKVVAMHDIKIGDEITFDYAINGDNEGTFECKCGSPNCRKIYNGNFFKLPIEIQKKYLPYLDDWFIKEHLEKIKLLETQL
ncbi:MAG: SET domain-containing protein-lysine N-methyltransferase [bacterium]|nr:SET domain-containing protein-lysine N-methyltransferase [bacterium]